MFFFQTGLESVWFAPNHILIIFTHSHFYLNTKIAFNRPIIKYLRGFFDVQNLIFFVDIFYNPATKQKSEAHVVKNLSKF